MDRQTLQRLIDEDVDGLLEAGRSRPTVTADDRLLASFKEICEFVTSSGREPQRNPRDMTESRLAMRLNALRENEQHCQALARHDEHGLLREPEPPSSLEEVLAGDLAELLDDEVPGLIEASSSKPQTMPDTIARRKPCPDFARFEPLFAACHAELRSGTRRLLPFKNPSEIDTGRFFVQAGVLLYVAEVGVRTADAIGKTNARTQCIFENGTESQMLLQSLASNLYKDGRRVTEPERDTMRRMGLEPEGDLATVYVLRSLSGDPQVTALTHLHKIGSTRQHTKARIAQAEAHATFLGAPVEVVAEYRVPLGVEKRVERLLHELLAPARVDAWFDSGGRSVDVTEWFAVPLAIIDDAVGLIENDVASNYVYDRERETFVLAAE